MLGTSDRMLDSAIEQLRQAYLVHPCTNKEMVRRIFNDFSAIRGPKEIGQLESEEAEVSVKTNFEQKYVHRFHLFAY